MKKYQLYRETTLPISLQEAWDFFSNPKNLSRITPAEMSFNVITPNLPPQISNGLEIEYIVKPLLGIPLKWKSLIREVNAPFMFADEQLKGPYSYWYHEHLFQEKDGVVLMIDRVTYAVPLGWLGRIANTILVKRKLAQIFDFRTEKILTLFKK